MAVKVRLVFVPPGGGEQDYSLFFELPEIPKAGDYITITRPDEEGTEDFIVRRTWWNLLYPKSDTSTSVTQESFGEAKAIVVECEFAVGPSASDSHKEACDSYKRKTGDLKEFDNSIY